MCFEETLMAMKRTTAAVAALILMAVPALAHHADSLYDLKNPVTVKGVVTRIEWTNPHAYLYITVKNAKGEPEEWSIQLNAPSALKRGGWTATTLKPGDPVSCTGGLARSGAHAMRCLTVETPDGKKLKS